MFSLEDAELLADGNDLEAEVVAGTEEGTQASQDRLLCPYHRNGAAGAFFVFPALGSIDTSRNPSILLL